MFDKNLTNRERLWNSFYLGFSHLTTRSQSGPGKCHPGLSRCLNQCQAGDGITARLAELSWPGTLTEDQEGMLATEGMLDTEGRLLQEVSPRSGEGRRFLEVASTVQEVGGQGRGGSTRSYPEVKVVVRKDGHPSARVSQPLLPLLLLLNPRFGGCPPPCPALAPAQSACPPSPGPSTPWPRGSTPGLHLLLPGHPSHHSDSQSCLSQTSRS